jgi:hypothetical protein
VSKVFELNIILKAVEQVNQTIKAKKFSVEKLKSLNENLKFSSIEYAKFQEVKSELHAMGVLSLETAQWIYQKLGDYSACSLAEKYILYELFAKFLQTKATILSKKVF